LILDENLKVWLLQTNPTAGMMGNSDVELFVKKQVAFDIYNLIRMIDFTIEDCRSRREYAGVDRIGPHIF
jgi:hypothetical protein